MTRFLSTCLALLLALSLVGCQSDDGDGELVIYSGRSKALVDSLVERYRQQTDATVSVRYGADAQLLAALNEEGDQSPADVFWANTTGALGNAIDNDLLTTLPDSLLDRPARFTPSGGRWVPITTRFRVMAYNADRVDPSAFPASVKDLPGLAGLTDQIGWTPTYSSFQDFVTALRVLEGDSTTGAWLQGIEALNPKSYSSNTPMIQALAAGEIDAALTNHYYVLRLKHGDAKSDATPRPQAPVETYHFEAGDVGNLALVTGAGALQTSNSSAEARRFLQFLLSEEAQQFAAQTLNEYPVVDGVAVPEYMMPVDEALRLSPDFDFERLKELDATLDLLRAEGLL